jgi:hypothetical protein
MRRAQAIAVLSAGLLPAVVACGSLLGLADLGYVAADAAMRPRPTDSSSETAEAGGSPSDSPPDVSAAALPTHIYVMGGWKGDADNVDVADVAVAEILADGSLGPWASATALPMALSYGGGANGPVSVLLVGGQQNGAYLGTTLAALVQDGGALGPWVNEEMLPHARFRHAVSAVGDFVYVTGGETFASDGAAAAVTLADVEYALENQDGTINPFQATTPLLAPRQRHASAASDAYVFVTCGNDDMGNGLGDVLVAPRQADGSLGAWVDETDTTLTPRWLHQAVVYDGYLLVLGGTTADGAFLNDVNFAGVGSGSSLTFYPTTPFPKPGRQGFGAIVVGDVLYVIGGDSGTLPYDSDVWFTKLSGGGQVVGWSQGPSLPEGRSYFGIAAR